jgi:KipI family sensor histidine kinase inhibitor
MIRLEPAGAEALLLVLAAQPDAGLPARIAWLAARVREQLGDWVRDLVPGPTSLLIHYDLLRCDLPMLGARLTPLLEQWLALPAQRAPAPRLHRLPVCYDGEDLRAVAEACRMRPAQLIELHSAGEYQVTAIGFAPGFAYLGELDPRLALPRRASPRQRVPAGSLAIAERQTAIYPQASPGGWHLIGRCPLRLFDPRQTPPCPLAVGDRVRFEAIDADTFQHLQAGA